MDSTSTNSFQEHGQKEPPESLGHHLSTGQFYYKLRLKMPNGFRSRSSDSIISLQTNNSQKIDSDNGVNYE